MEFEPTTESDKIIEEDSKIADVIQVDGLSGNSKKKIIIFSVLGAILIILIVTLIVVFTLKSGDDIEVLPPFILNSTSGNHTHTVIFMPGLSNIPEHFNNTFSNKMQFTKKKDTTIIILRSPLAHVTALNGKNYSWFDTYNIPLDDFSDINLDELKKSAKVLEKVVNNEVNILGGDYSKIIVGGHSQGASIALYQAYTTNKTYGGIFSFSGILPPGDINNDKRNLSAWVGYGDKDNIIIPSFMERSLQRIKDFEGLNITIYANHDHKVSTQEAKDAAKFLDKIIK